MIFADFSLNSQAIIIVIEFYKHYFLVMPWRYRRKILYSLKVSQFNM